MARKTGLKLKTKPIRGFVNTYEKIDGINLSKFPYLFDKQVTYTDENFDFDDLSNDCKIRLYGFFQKIKLYEGYPVKEWLQINNLFEAHPQDVVVHIRIGDYVKLKRMLAPEFYLKSIALAQPRKLYICTDSPRSDLLNLFDKFNPEIVNLDTIKTFQFIKSFQKIIISQSTFSWWAAYLSNAEEIYFPKVYTCEKLFNWHNHDLIPNEKRYIVIDKI
ncbi:MAG: alpha-1,2-fucosyltransferase [Oscillatoria sp. PMC 1068.18]|nr:alpha-1,2-fucosyltransferase [Oscillatoria sp. PMC 1068.18]